MEPLTLTHPDGTIEVLYDPTPKQRLFHAREEPNVLFYGGRGSGKSVALRWEAHIRALATPGFTYCILRRTSPELQKSHLMFIDEEMKKLGGYFHGTKMMAVYPNGSKGIYSHCADDKDVLNLLSAQFVWMGFDEVSTFPWEMFTKLAASVRVNLSSGLVGMVRCCTNPLGVSAEEINRYFLLKDIETEEDPQYNPNDWYAIQGNLEDNPHIDAEQYRKRFSGLSATTRKAWVDGEFSLENALFDFQPRITIEEDGERKTIPYHVLPSIERDKIIAASQIYRAYDHGYFPDPAVCLWIAHLGNRYVVIHEAVWRKEVASKIAEDIKGITEDLGIKRVITTYCDPTMDIHTGHDVRTLRDIFEYHGVPMDPSINNRELYAASVHQALAEEAMPHVPRLQIFGKGAPYLTKTLPQQRYNPKRVLAMDDHPHDHATVALAYFLISHSSEQRQEIPEPKQIPRWLRPKLGDRFVLGSDNVRDKSYH